MARNNQKSRLVKYTFCVPDAPFAPITTFSLYETAKAIPANTKPNDSNLIVRLSANCAGIVKDDKKIAVDTAIIALCQLFKLPFKNSIVITPCADLFRSIIISRGATRTGAVK